MKPETKEKLKEAALKEGAKLARDELPGLIGRIRKWLRKRRAAKAKR